MFISLLIVFVLIIVNGLFSGTEMALVKLRESQIEKLEKKSKSGRGVAELARDPNRFLATIQIGITLAGFLASAVAAVGISNPIGNFVGNIFQSLESLATFSALIIVTLVLSYFTLVFGELVPKRIAMRQPEKWVTVTAPPLLLLNKLFSPAVLWLSHSTDFVMKLLGFNPGDNNEEINQQELRDMVLAHHAITEDHRNIMRGAFEVSERRLGKVVSPRQTVFWLKNTLTCGQALTALNETEFSRAPVCSEDNLDSIVGIVHLRDLLKARKNMLVKNVMREVSFYPETSEVLPTMRTMQKNRVNLAVVVDEYGSISGIVTLEDLLEEIVGEIYDDYDRPVKRFQTLSSGKLVLPGTFPIYDLPEVGITVEDGPYATLAGFLLDQINEIPKKAGITLHYQDFLFTIKKITHRRIEEVSVEKLPDETRLD